MDLIKIIILITVFITLIIIGQNQVDSCKSKNYNKYFNRVTGSSNDGEDPAVTTFREYLRINSAFPNPDYESCINWIKNQANEIGLDFNLERFKSPDLFALWLTWTGTNPLLKSILINSHIDVVAVDNSKWDYDPFGAYKDEYGFIYGRGTVDMKSGTVGVLEAIRRLKKSGFKPLRTIHISIMPDEEIGGGHGMKAFVNSPYFSKLNVGFDLDETGVSPTNEMYISYAEKSLWQFNFTARGMAGHASIISSTITAGQKLQIVINKILEYRKSQVELLNDPKITTQDVSSVNLVRIGGGTGNNIIPDELWASFDMRVKLKSDWNYTNVENMLNKIAEEAGPNVTYEYIVKSMETGITPIDSTNIWWTELQKTCQQMNVKCIPIILSGVTDGRFVRNVGIPAFGINPFLNTVKMAHQNNEHINEKNFLEGIERYVILIRNFASVTADKDEANNLILN